MSELMRALAPLVFSPDQLTYAVLDGATVKGLRQKLREEGPPHVCLYRGDLEPDMEEVAPYLVQLANPEAELSKWIVNKGWGKHWGIFVHSGSDLRALRQHFRRFLTVHDEAGKPMLFRYYDPRVFRVFAPTCTPSELQTLFGPVSAYLLEDEEPTALLQLKFEGGKLTRKQVRLEGK